MIVPFLLAGENDTPKLRFDGVYQAHPGGGSQSLYIRFYPDNYATVMSYAKSPEEVSHLIDRGFSELPQGSYQTTNGIVSFTTKAARGEIDYSGKIYEGYIAMHIHSRITDFSADERFDFRPVTFKIDRKAFEQLDHDRP
jgi:hypothetical protein